uniref:penicillin-binding protein 1A n=1 Tax=Ndongobacter massiliensis TaxID=1871025 RepID=UPI00093149EE|nr:transglycosylase domain-containing protein [Ndongobacter massiliensis]
MAKRTMLSVLRIIGILIISFLIFLAILGGYLAGAMLLIAGDSPEVNPQDMLANLKQNSIIVDENGNLIEKIETEEFREVVPYDKIPKDLINAFVSAEDKRFFEHNGIDILGVLSTLRDFASGGGLRGASTITMQLTRNVYLSNKVEWSRKIQEMYLALKIDEQLGKEQILEAYLNRVFFGQNAYGVQAAAQIYFSKNVWELDLAQCAILAGVVQAPSDYALYSLLRPSSVTTERVLGETTINGDRYIAVYNAPAYERMGYVLERMLEDGKITQEQYDQAMAEDVAATIAPPSKRADNLSTYFTDLVKEQVLRILMDTQNISLSEAADKMNYGGLTITATIDLDLQRRLQDEAMRLNEVLNGDTTGSAGPNNLSLNYDESGNIINVDGYLQYFAQSNLMSSDNRVFIPNDQYHIAEDGSVTFQTARAYAYGDYIDFADYYNIDDKGILKTHRVGTVPLDASMLQENEDGSFTISAAFFAANPTFYEAVDGGICLNRDFYQVDDAGVMQPQVAFTVLSTTTGEVKAIIGGREQESTRHFLNRAASFPRQPGSSIKPIATYTGLLDNGYNLSSSIPDLPSKMIDGRAWPRNAYGTYDGLMTIREGLRFSSNAATVRWLDRLTIPTSKEYLARYGLIDRNHPERDTFTEASEDPNHNDENLSMTLGAFSEGMTTLRMANAFQAIGNNGTRIDALAVSSIVDHSGKVYFQNEHTGIPVVSPQINYQLLSALLEVANQSYTSGSQISGIQTAGKTGTTDDNSDLWFCGTTPYYTMAVWLGSDNSFLSLSGNSSVAANLFGALSAVIHQGLEEKSFAQPDGMYTVDVCGLTGKLATEACALDPTGHGIRSELVCDENAPKETCDVHVIRKIDKRNKLLAADGTPEPFVETRGFIQYGSDYVPGNFGGITPTDWQYLPPSKVSTLPTKIEPKTVKNADGSETVITYDPTTWTKKEVTKFKDGTIVTVETTLDGKVTTTTEKPVQNPQSSAPTPPEASESSSALNP